MITTVDSTCISGKSNPRVAFPNSDAIPPVTEPKLGRMNSSKKARPTGP